MSQGVGAVKSLLGVISSRIKKRSIFRHCVFIFYNKFNRATGEALIKSFGSLKPFS